jgi:hypothetical protein
MGEYTRSELYSIPELKSRGWTITTINKLGDPDDYRKNPVYSSASPMKMYCKSRVELFETSDQFKVHVPSESRKLGAVKAVQTKIGKLIKQIENFHIEVELVDQTKLQSMAINAYNNLCFNRGKSDIATNNSEQTFLDRITVNFIRHELTSYDEQLYQLYGKTGKEYGVDLVATKIFDKIMEVYPKYKHECHKQLQRRGLK